MLKWGSVLSEWDVFPCNPAKKRMILKLLKGYSFFRIFLEQLDQNISEVMAYCPNQAIQYLLDIGFLYVGLNLVISVVLIIFEQVSGKFELEHQHAYCPQVYFFAIVSLQCLGCCVLQSSYESGDGVVFRHDHLGQPVIRQFYMALISDQDVFGLEFPINNSLCMQNLDSHDYLCDQHLDDILGEGTLFAFQVVVDIPSGHVLHNNVNFALVLESLPDGSKQGIFTYLPDPLTLQNIEFLYFTLVDYLHGVLVIIFLVLRQHHIPERPTPQIFY